MSSLSAALVALSLLAGLPDPITAPAPTDAPAAPAEVAPADAAAAGEGPSEAEMAAMLAQFEASLNYQRGEITLPNGKAVLTVPDGFRFLAADDARRVLEQLWGNPPNPAVLGMLFPSDVSPTDPEAGWGVVVQYTEEGHIDDADAAGIDYDELLASMQEGLAEENKQRREQGFPEVQLGGWAEPPHYDGGTHKLYWAKRLRFGADPIETLNYAIRVLGREGVLELNAVAPMERLPAVKPAMEQVLGFVEFTAGNRYGDFNPDSDKTAAYGIGGLIAGAVVASKTGLLKGLWIAILAGKKFIILGVVAIGAFFAKRFGRGKSE